MKSRGIYMKSREIHVESPGIHMKSCKILSNSVKVVLTLFIKYNLYYSRTNFRSTNKGAFDYTFFIKILNFTFGAIFIVFDH